MSLKDFAAHAAAFLFACMCATGVSAVTLTYDFTAQCDDCAFNGNPGDPGFGFDPNTNTFSYLNDGLTQTVTGKLTLNGVFDSNGVFNVDLSTSTFSYNGSNLINSFIATNLGGDLNGEIDFSGLTPSLQTQLPGQGQSGSQVTFGAFANADPNNPNFFPNFCTALGQQFFAPDPTSPLSPVGDSCTSVQFIFFTLDNNGDWSITGTQGFDIGGSGQFTLTSVPLPGSAVLLISGLVGFSRYMRRSAK